MLMPFDDNKRAHCIFVLQYEVHVPILLEYDVMFDSQMYN